MVRRGFLLIAAVLLAETVFGGNASWTTNGPYGDPGPVLFHPADPNAIFSGFYRSTDRGLTWTSFKPPLPDEILQIGTKPPYNLFVAAVNGALILHKSTDLGLTWSRMSITRLPVHGATAGLSDFRVSKSNSDVQYTSIVGAGVLRSGDGGKTWMILTRDLPDPKHSSGVLHISPTSSNVVYYIYFDSRTGAVALLKTTNGGRSWRSVGPALESMHGMTLRVDPQNQDIVYIGNDISQYKTVDGGKTWRRLALPLSSGTPNFWVNPRDTNEVWATRAQSYKSTDGGNTWTPLAWPHFNHPYMVAFDSRSTLMFASGLDLLRSTDDGKTWNTSNTGLHGLQSLFVDANTSRPVRLLVPSGPFGVYRSTDSGLSWSSFIRFNYSSIGIIRSHPQNGLILGAIVDSNQFRISTNNGASWKSTAIRSFDFAFHPQNQRTIYFLNGKSTDGGATFQAYSLRPDGIGAEQVVVDPGSGETVYLKTDRSLYKSTDGGRTWSRLRVHSISLRTLQIAPSNPNILYVGSDDGIYTSSNAGASWVHYGKNSGVLDPAAVDPANPLALFAIRFGFRLQLTTDGGRSFTNFDPSGLPPGIDLYSVVFDALNPNTLHLSTSNGVYSYTRP